MPRRLRVIIAGGGIGGLTAALAFRKAGHTVEIVERAPVFASVGAGLLLQANGLMVLDALGLGEEARARGTQIPRFFLRDRLGACLFQAELGEHLPTHLLPVCISRAHLHEILWRACRGARINVRLDCRATAVEDQFSRPVLICDAPEGAFRISGDLIVGADGINSAIRDASGIESQRWPLIEGSVQGVFPGVVPASHHGEYMGGAEACGMLPMGEGSTFWFWGGGSRRAVEDLSTRDFAGWKANVCARFPPMETILSHYESWADAVQLQHRTVCCETWSSGNVVLIGDAAHAMSPNLGQGANSGLVDALALVCHAAAAGRDCQLSDALARFEQARRPQVDALQRKGHAEGASPLRRWIGFETTMNFLLRLARFASSDRKRNDILALSGLDGTGFDLRSAGIRPPLPW